MEYSAASAELAIHKCLALVSRLGNMGKQGTGGGRLSF
jgi:hypothetical protein